MQARAIPLRPKVEWTIKGGPAVGLPQQLLHPRHVARTLPGHQFVPKASKSAMRRSRHCRCSSISRTSLYSLASSYTS